MIGKGKLWLVLTRFRYLLAFLMISLIIFCYSYISASGSVRLTDATITTFVQGRDWGLKFFTVDNRYCCSHGLVLELW